MNKFQLKIYFAIIFAAIVGISFLYLNHSTKNILQSHSLIIHQLSDIELYNEKISREILQSAFELYKANDEINQQLKALGSLYGLLNKNPLLKEKSFIRVSKKLQQSSLLNKNLKKSIEKFMTLNAMIKNSSTYIPNLTTRYLERFGYQDKDYVIELSKITSSVYLAHNAMDPDLIKTVENSIKQLQSKQFDSKEKESFNRTFLAHAKVMVNYLPLYQEIFNNIIGTSNKKLIHQTQLDFISISSAQANKLAYMSFVMMTAFLFSILLIVYLLFNVEKNRKKQIQLHQRLSQLAMTDSLTGLASRFAFEQDEENLPKDCYLILINIDGFKHINDFYGRRIGDRLLRHLAQIIKDYLSTTKNTPLYRVGTDDFAIIQSGSNNKQILIMLEQLIRAIANRLFIYKDICLLLQVSIGISNVRPLLETADIALREVKNTRKTYQFYNKDHEQKNDIRSNMTMMQFIQQAIKFDYVVPYFMPLMRNSDNKIIAFECLMRLMDSNGKIYYPDTFLPVAKSGRLYGKLTQIMFNKCVDKFEPTDYLFSINISMEDIEDNEVTDCIIKRLEQSPEVGKRLTLEILESEDIHDYQKLHDFVIRIKTYGCKIALDDYGSGYSNLQHLVRLQVDGLKLDGSIVEPMVSDNNSVVAVNAIVDMANDLKIASTTAEYVSNKDVLEQVKSSNITYSQGYFIGKASPELVDKPAFLQS